MPNQVLQGRYELRRPIGSGGMAKVWEAHDDVLERLVAVKTVDLDGSDDPTLGERLQREARATATLAHPDIVTVYDAGIEGSTVFFVMELLPGQDLAALLRDGPLPVDEAVRIGARISGALAAAHEAGIVHRDVKPANVLVDGPNVTVVDFGIAAMAHEAGAALTRPGTVLGTAQFMAPEQANGRVASPASDMYALGCVLTAMLAGAPPFSGKNPLAVLQQQVAATPPSLLDARPDAPDALVRLVEGLLAKDPEARPSARDVERVLVGLGVTAPGLVAAATKVLPTAGTPAVLSPDGATEVLPVAALPVAGAAASSDRPDSTPPASTSQRSRPRWLLVAGAVAALLVAVVAIALGTGGNDPGTPQVTQAAPVEPAPGEPAVEPAPAAPPTAADVAALLGGLQADDEARGDLLDRWDEITAALTAGNAAQAAEMGAELSAKLDELVQDGTLSAADAETVRAAMVAVLGELPPIAGDGDGDDDGTGSGKGNGNGNGKDEGGGGKDD